MRERFGTPSFCLEVNRTRSLTEQEQAFADENHGLVLAFMSQYDLSPDYYDQLALRYLNAVVRYCSEAELRQYAFSTIVWRHLRSELSNILRQQRAEPVMSPYEPDIDWEVGCESPIDSNLWRELEDMLTYKQCEAIFLRNQGYTNREIADLCGVKPKAIEKRFHRIRKIMKKKENEL